MVTYPEGDVAAYLHSLERVAGLEPRMLFPGHWDPVTGAAAKIEEYRSHRLAREQQVLEDLRRGGPGTVAALTRRVYGQEVEGEELLRAAEMTLRAHLRKLADEGRVSVTGPAGGETYALE
jgi:hydroxyacylglutathione hydrolase